MGHPTVTALHFHALLNEELPEVEFALIKRWRTSASPLIWGYRRSLRPSAMLRRFPIYGPRRSWLQRWFTRSSHEFARRPAPRSRGLRSRMVTHKLMVPYIGFFGSIPRGVAQVLTYSWAFLVVLMWRNSSRGCLT